MLVNMVGAFIRNAPFGTEIAFKKGLERIGCRVNAVDTSYPDQQFDTGADATIVFKWMEGYWDQLDACSGVKIVYQPDDARFPHIREMIMKMRDHVDNFLSFDDFSAKLAKSMGYKNAETLLLTADDELYVPRTVEKDIDVSFVGSLTAGSNHHGRSRMCRIVQEKANRVGWRTWFGSTESIPEILDIYWRSKVVLNHATDVGQSFGSGFGLQCRHFEVGMTATALLSNTLLGSVTDLPFDTFSSEDELLNKVELWISYPALARTAGQNLYNSILESHLPQHRGAQLMDFISRCS